MDHRINQKHFLCTILGPESLYSSLEIHISWNVDNDDIMEPPIQTEYFLSGGATTFTFLGANACISLVRRTSKFGNMVDPPHKTMLVYMSLLHPPHFMIVSYANLWIPSLSIPIKFGLNST